MAWPPLTRSLVGRLTGRKLSKRVLVAGARWGSAALGGAIAGARGGLRGGIVLRLAPGADPLLSLPVGLAAVGFAIGGIGAAGVGAGLAAAESVARSERGVALVLGGSLGGGVVGWIAHAVGTSMLEGVFGQDVSAVGGGLEGLVLGAGAGIGEAVATARSGGGMAAPRGGARLRAALATGATCSVAALILTWTGHRLEGMWEG